MTALIRDGNTWQHPEFGVTIDDDGNIVVELRDPLAPIDARDLVQALAQAIAAGEVAEVSAQTSGIVVK